MESHKYAEGLEELNADLGFPSDRFLEDVEDLDVYCRRNNLRRGHTDDMYTGVVGSTRYFVKEDPDDWVVASYLVADAFIDSYDDLEGPSISYVDGDLFKEGIGESPVPISSCSKEFSRREKLPNWLQRDSVSSRSLDDSFFVHIAGGAHDISNNVAKSGSVAYPFDFQDFGKSIHLGGFTSFVEGRKNSPEQLYDRNRNLLGLSGGSNGLRSHVNHRASEFDEDVFYDNLEENLSGLESEVVELAEDYAGNLVSNIDDLESIS